MAGPGVGNDGPSLVVRAAFGQNPLAGAATSYTWTDISAYALNYSSRGGRQHELGRFEARTASILLDNTDGRFSPYNTSSPYNGNLVPSTPIWVQAVYSGASFSRFFGYADDWTMQWVGPGYSNVQLDCTDGLGLLALYEFGQVGTTSLYQSLILGDGVTDYYRCADVVGSETLADSGPGDTLLYVVPGASGNALFGVQGALYYDPSTAVDLTNGTNVPNAGFASFDGTAIDPDGIEMWIKSSGSIGGNGAVLVCPANNGTSDLVIWIDLSGNVVLGTMPAPTARITSSNINVADGNWHYISATFTGSPSIQLGVDGVNQGSTSVSGVFAVGTIGAPNYGFLSGYTAWPGAIDEVGLYVFPSTLTTTEQTSHATVGSYFRKNELSGARVLEALATVPIPSALESVATGFATVAGETESVVGTKVLDYIGSVTDTEPSSFWQDFSGVFTFLDRYFALEQLTSVLTFSDDPAVPGMQYEMGSPDLALDALDLWPTVTVQRNNGTVQVATSSAGIARYGPREDDITGVLYTNDADSLALAQWYQGLYGTPVQRVAGIDVSLYSKDGSAGTGGAHVAAVLGLTFLQRVTVRKKTHDSGTAFQQDSSIEGIDETVTGGPNSSWTVTFHLSPYDIANGKIFIWDSSTQGKWDSGVTWGL